MPSKLHEYLASYATAFLKQEYDSIGYIREEQFRSFYHCDIKQMAQFYTNTDLR